MTTVYSNYQPVNGIQMAFQMSRFRHGQQISQICASLDKHFKK